MTTEKEIVYYLMETLRDAEYNNDERVDERFLRSLLLKYRAESLRKHLKNGVHVSDDLFQIVSLNLTRNSENQYVSTYPKIIRFSESSSFYLTKKNYNIPILSSESFYLSKNNFHGKGQPRAKIEGYNIILEIGNIRHLSNLNPESESRVAVIAFIQDVINDESNLEIQNGQFGGRSSQYVENYIQNNSVSVQANLKAILHNPSEANNYDWENDIYPFPSERIPELTDQILGREFQFMKQAKRDEIQNARADEVRYHDNTDVSET
jgi:hypothetical protein